MLLRKAHRPWVLAFALAFCAAIAAAIVFYSPMQAQFAVSGIADHEPQLRKIASVPIPEPQIYKPLTREEGLAANAALPFSSLPVERPPAFNLVSAATDPLVGKTALECLTSAIYYEAGNESYQGQRAVAQVILNRVRHPAFPNSVCGVVLQGSERRTGCQFTYTCDGSLARKPSLGGWQRAQSVALLALSGLVEPSVGMATHYHADYVMPYWAPKLDKIAQIGTHIFYKWKGGWGRRDAFTSRYAGESIGSAQLASLTGLLPIDMNVMTDEPSAPVGPPKATLAADRHGVLVHRGDQLPPGASGGTRILADERQGTLAVDASAVPGPLVDLQPMNRLRSQMRIGEGKEVTIGAVQN